ncbi:MAG: chlorite dismutase family protein [Acidimicrobiales bacterium]|jgi:peroxiredoxin
MTTHDIRPAIGQGVLHLFFKTNPTVDGAAAVAAVEAARGREDQVVSVAMLGHKADIAVMSIGPNLWSLRELQTDLVGSGLELVDSYVSLTELSEYSRDAPEEMRNMRLYPNLPPEGKHAWCFYPMSKKRVGDVNWFTLEYERRKELMYEHGTSGRKFAGRIVQLITGSTGLDDYEWGVTLFGVHPDDLKEVVYTMRFDEASSVYAEFGPFYTGMVAELDEIMGRRP